MKQLSTEFKHWTLEKQFMAAKFFLESEKPLFINEAQKSQLMALNMQVVYGACKEDILFPEIEKFSNAEKKRMFRDWKQLGNESKIPAMKRFIDLMNNLFPNWCKSHKILNDFELDWFSFQSTGDNPSSPSYLSEPKYFRSSEKKLNTFKSEGKLSSNSVNTPKFLKTRPSFYKTNEISTAISTVRSGNKDISRFSDMYKLKHLLTPEKEEKQDYAPVILRNLFENLENQYNSKQSKKPMVYKDTFSGINPKVRTYETLEQNVERTRNLLLFLDEKANEEFVVYGNSTEEFETEIDALKYAMKMYQTDAVDSILRRRLNLFSGMIKEIELIFQKEGSSQVKVVAEIHTKFKEAIEYLFSYLHRLNKKKNTSIQKKLFNDKTVAMLEQGFLAIKELNNPDNIKYGLYGNTKLTREQYYQNLHASKAFVQQKPQEIMIDIETMLAKSEEKINSLQRELSNRDEEIRYLNEHLRKLKEKHYQDNVGLSNENRELKEKLGINRGGKPRESAFDRDSKIENERLRGHVEKLVEEKNNLYQEVMNLRSKIKG